MCVCVFAHPKGLCWLHATSNTIQLFRQLLLTTIIVNNVYEKLPRRIGVSLLPSLLPLSLHFATLAIVWHIFWFCLVDCLISFLPVTGSNCSASSTPNFFSFLLFFLLLLFVVCSLASWAIALNGKHFTFVTRSEQQQQLHKEKPELA